MRLEPGRPAAHAIDATLLPRRCCLAAALLVAVLLPAGLFAQAQDPAPIVQIEGTVAARRAGAVQVSFVPRDGVVPRAGDLVSFSLEIDGIVAAGGSGSVVEIETDLVWVEVAAGRPDLGMQARIAATGRIDPDAEIEVLRDRAMAGDCDGVRPALERRAASGSLLAAQALGSLQIDGDCGARETERGLALLLGAAEGGLVRAMRSLSIAHGFGRAGAVDEKLAVEWARRAAATGEPWGLESLAWCHLLGWVEGADPQEGARLMKQAADAGIAGANEQMGELYHQGRGVPRDADQALTYLRRAMDLGDRTNAPYYLGRLYERGDGVPQDLPRAIELYEQAVEGRNTQAMTQLARVLRFRGDGVSRDPGRAAELLRRAIELGDDKDAVANLATMHATGEGGVPLDVPRAVELLRQAAAAGSADAHSSLAFHYSLGIGVPRDASQAARLLLQAIQLGDQAMAPWLLGSLYEKGDGVPRNLSEALRLYGQAAAMGNREAMLNLGRLHEQGIGVVRDIETAVSWYEKALPIAGAEEALARLGRRH